MGILAQQRAFPERNADALVRSYVLKASAEMCWAGCCGRGRPRSTNQAAASASEKSTCPADVIAFPFFWIECTRHSSRCSGKSLLKCPPRDSSRQRAARATSTASVTKLRDDVLRFDRSICSNSAIARLSEPASRSIPTRSHITRFTRFRTAVLIDGLISEDRPFTIDCPRPTANCLQSSAAASPALAPKTKPSSSELDASRFAP